MKNKRTLEQPSGKPTDPVLELMRKMSFEMTQEVYLDLAYPEGINSEAESLLPEEFYSLPKK